MAMKDIVRKGTTSYVMPVFLQDSSGDPETGKDHTDIEKLSYYRSGASAEVSVTAVDMTAGTWVSGGFEEVDATEMPGLYLVGVPDAALALGDARHVIVEVTFAADALPVCAELRLVDKEPYSGNPRDYRDDAFLN